MYKLLACLVLVLLMGCTEMKHYSFGGLKPAWLMMEMPEEMGPPLYRQGYADGCESGYKGYSTSFKKTWYEWKQDPELAKNPVYYRIWKDAYNYCALAAMINEAHGLGNWR